MAVSKNTKSKKRLLVNALHPEECRVAIVDGDILEDIHIEKASMEQIRGNIYKGVVMRVEPGLQAAFVEFEKDRKHGFLQFKEIRPEYYKPREGQTLPERPKIQDVLHKKQELIVQVEKDARDQKGASLTTYLSLAGRYLVMAVGQSKVGISRKIEGVEDRGRLRDIAKELTPPEGFGLIVRTSGLSQTEEVLKAEMDHLLGLWKEIEAKAAEVKAPGLVHQEQNVVIRAVRDYLTEDVGEILLDSREVSQRVKEYLHQHIPSLEKRVKLHREKIPLFSKYGVEDQLDLVHERKVQLPSGGSIVIDTTEALTAIDVNSGKTQGERDIEDLALRTNLEAVEAIARQLRLRDLGGLIVIDFIDMLSMRNRRAVEDALRDILKKDKAKTDVSRISKFGLLEISRQRLRPSFRDSNYITCPVCNGSGHYRSAEFLALTVLREFQELVEEDGVMTLRAALPAEAANYLLNQKRSDLMELEKRSGRIITVETSDVRPGHYRLWIEREGGAVEERDSALAAQEEETRRKRKKSKRRKEQMAEVRTAAENRPTQSAEAEDADEKEDLEPKQQEGQSVSSSAEMPPGASQEQAPGAPGRKRRRRRRRKKHGQGQSQPATGAQPPAGSSDEVDERHQVHGAPSAPSHSALEPPAADTPMGSTGEPTGQQDGRPSPTGAPESRNKKRRRRGRRPDRVDQRHESGPTASEASAPETKPAPETAEISSETSTPTARKKHHRRRRPAAMTPSHDGAAPPDEVPFMPGVGKTED